jgi:hypothetical protein
MAVRSPLETNYPEAVDEQPLIDAQGRQARSEGLPPLTQLVSHGSSYQVRTTTAAAPVTAIPSTACLLGLWNGEPDNGKSYIIDSVFLVRVATSAAFQEATILANVSIATIPTAIANTLTPRPLAGNRVGYGGNARVAVGITLAAVAGGATTNWFPVGSSGHNIAGGATNLGGTLEVDCKGRFIIPPKGQFSLSVIAPVATASSVQVGVRWHEVLLPVAV